MSDEKVPFPKRAATASCGAALISWILPVMIRNSMAQSFARGSSQWRSMNLMIGVTTIAIMLIGIMLAIVALRGMKQFGRKDIMRPALLGLTFNILGLALIVAGFVVAMTRH